MPGVHRKTTVNPYLYKKIVHFIEYFKNIFIIYYNVVYLPHQTITNIKKIIMKTIYTNGKSLFTLEDFGKTAGVCEVNGITKHSDVSDITRRAMHSNGQLHYIFGIGDRKELKGISLKRGMNLNSFKVK